VSIIQLICIPNNKGTKNLVFKKRAGLSAGFSNTGPESLLEDLILQKYPKVSRLEEDKANLL